MSRLAAIERLQDGWDGPGSVAVGSVAFREYRAFVDRFPRTPADLEPMPTPTGGLRMEWDRGASSYIAEIERDGGMFLCFLGPDENDDFEVELNAADIDMLVNFYEGRTIG